jgi:hypothetical protein
MDLPDIIGAIVIALLLINLFLALHVRRDAISEGMSGESAIMWGALVFATSLAGAVLYILFRRLGAQPCEASESSGDSGADGAAAL